MSKMKMKPCKLIHEYQEIINTFAKQPEPQSMKFVPIPDDNYFGYVLISEIEFYELLKKRKFVIERIMG